MDNLEDYGPTGSFYYVFDENMTYLHKYFSDATTRKLLFFLHNKITEIVMSITMLIYLVLLVGWMHTIFFAVYTIICSVFIWIPFCVTWLLSVNIEGRKIVCKSFEFWFKIAYAFGYMINGSIINFGYKADTFEMPWLSLIARILIELVVIMAIAITGLYDAVKMHKVWKVVICLICALTAILVMIRQQLIAYQDGDVYMRISDGIGFSLTATQISITRVLAIFLTKQAWFTWKRAPRNKCVSMKYTPFIEWINSKEDENKQRNDEKL